MNAESNRPVALTLRLYRALASAYPHEFRNVWGDEMLQVAEDAIEPIWRRHGVAGLARLLLDLAFRIPIEYLSEMRQDVRYGLRMLASSPGFTAVALISLSLGTGIGTSSWSEMNGMVLRDVPGVWKPDDLVALMTPASFPLYKRYRERADLFSSTMSYVAPVPLGVSRGGHTERSWGHLITPSYFATLSVRPALGRFPEEDQERPGPVPVVAISDRFWRERLNADPTVIGRQLRINGHACTIVAVGPPDFLGASPDLFPADLWVPFSSGIQVAPELAGGALDRRDLTMFQMVGRLKPGVPASRAEAELDAVARAAERDWGVTRREKGRTVSLLQGGKVLPMRKQDVPFFTYFFIVLAGLVMLITCANVANMMLARASARRKEIAVRLALGASRARLIRQLLTESMLVAGGAGVLGFLISMVLMSGASHMTMPYPMPISYDLRPDWRALVFTLALTVFAGLAFGLAPALQATRTDLTPALKEGGEIRLRRFRRLSLRNLLMVSQVAGSLSLLLLIGLLSLGIQGSMGIQEGFDPKNLFLISLDPVRDGYRPEQAAAFFDKLLDRVKRLPAVSQACLTDTLPATMNGNHWLEFFDAGVAKSSAESGYALRYVVGKDYFETAGIRILRGRGFRKEDEADGATAVIVTEAVVHRYWKNEDPLGRRIEVRTGAAVPAFASIPGTFDYRSGDAGTRTFEVVGLARNVNEEFVAKKEKPAIYFPLRPAEYAQPSVRGVTLLVRGVPGADAIGAVEREVSAMNPGLATFNARSMGEQIAQFLSPLRSASWTYGLIGVFGLILASVGLAGVTAYSVAQRAREIGIRIALGAQRADVLALVMKEAALLVAVGTAIGLSIAWAGFRLLSNLLAAVSTTSTSNPVLVLGAPALLAGLALVACYLPARKSMRIDPAVALRQE
jgi:putative ABC transport system permease protein